jgi:hypothetical protein
LALATEAQIISTLSFATDLSVYSSDKPQSVFSPQKVASSDTKLFEAPKTSKRQSAYFINNNYQLSGRSLLVKM